MTTLSSSKEHAVESDQRSQQCSSVAVGDGLTAEREVETVPRLRSFAALHDGGFRTYLATFFLAMMADNIEHVISYWVAFQKFHSPALGGFAVVSHWLPFLVLSVPVGAFAERFDPRRIIQAGICLFMIVSLTWGCLIVTDALQMWHAMVLLVLHGCAAVLFVTSGQVLLHSVVTHELLPSAVRLSATARYLAMLAGPAAGGALMLLLGPWRGMLINAAIYLPVFVWLLKAPFRLNLNSAEAAPRRRILGWGDLMQGVHTIARDKSLLTMTLLAGAASFFVGNSYQAQMPGLADDLGHGDGDATYSLLLAADAAGALLAGIVLESRGLLRPSTTVAIAFGMIWCTSLTGFAITKSYPVALALLFIMGACELLFSSMAQAVVQLNAPAVSRGRVIGAFNMASLGLRAFSGVTVGLAGSVVGVRGSLAGSALCSGAILVVLLLRQRRRVKH
jgi:MFS family permease